MLLLASSTAGAFAAAGNEISTNSPPVNLPPQDGEREGGDIIVQSLTGESEMEQSLADGITYFRHGVVLRYDHMELSAAQVALSEQTGDIIADGSVRFRDERHSWTGEHLEYNYKTGLMKSEAFRAGFAPFYASGLQLDADVNAQTFTGTDTYVTTDDVKNPVFRVRAKEFRIVAGKSVEARNATVYLGNTPVFRVPYYKRVFTRHYAFWRVTPGYRSVYGPYLRSSYHFPLTTNVLAGVDIDLYQKRGIGFGPDFEWYSPKWGTGNFRYYTIHDNDPSIDPFNHPIQDDRHRISFSHQVTLRTNLTAKLVVREQSDPYIIRDFFESEYRQDTQPQSFLEVNQTYSNWSLDFLARPQLNDFYQTTERLPDVRLSGIRQQIGESPLFYESETSLAYLRFEPGIQPGIDPQLTNLSTNYAAMRGDSFHQILWPQTYFGWLNVVPRVGGRVTQYGDTDTTDGTAFEDRTRFVLNTGAEVSTKASRIWRGAESSFWDVHELRHIIEPSINYVFVPDPNYRPNELPQFDTEIPSLRLLPIEFPDYNAIDAVDSQNVIRLTLRNKLQTKREKEVQNLVNWAVYTDWRLNPRPDQTTFSDIYSDLDLRPRSWLSLSSQTRFDLHTHQWNASYTSATISPNSTWSWQLGHFYFRGGPEFGANSDNNTIFSTFYYKLNENWGARLTHHFEARDGTLEEQYYTIYRDFRSWTAAFTFRVRDNRDLGMDYGFAVTFQLKAFPFHRHDFNEHSFLLGG